MHYDALELAKYIVVKCMKDGHPISNMRLQFLLYIVQREFLQVKNHCAYYDETQAWAFGPCIRNVYADFCMFGGMEIEFPVEYLMPNIENIKLDNQDKYLIDILVNRYRTSKPWEINDVVKPKGGAWDIVWADGSGFKMPIPFDLIKSKG